MRLPKILRITGRFSDCARPGARAHWICAVGKSGHAADRESVRRVRLGVAIAACEPTLTGSGGRLRATSLFRSLGRTSRCMPAFCKSGNRRSPGDEPLQPFGFQYLPSKNTEPGRQAYSAAGEEDLGGNDAKPDSTPFPLNTVQEYRAWPAGLAFRQSEAFLSLGAAFFRAEFKYPGSLEFSCNRPEYPEIQQNSGPVSAKPPSAANALREHGRFQFSFPSDVSHHRLL